MPISVYKLPAAVLLHQLQSVIPLVNTTTDTMHVQDTLEMLQKKAGLLVGLAKVMEFLQKVKEVTEQEARVILKKAN